MLAWHRDTGISQTPLCCWPRCCLEHLRRTEKLRKETPVSKGCRKTPVDASKKPAREPVAPRVLLSLEDSFWTQEQTELLRAFYKAILFVWQWFPECLDVAVVLLLLLQQLVLLGFAAQHPCRFLEGSWLGEGGNRDAQCAEALVTAQPLCPGGSSSLGPPGVQSPVPLQDVCHLGASLVASGQELP